MKKKMTTLRKSVDRRIKVKETNERKENRREKIKLKKRKQR